MLPPSAHRVIIFEELYVRRALASFPAGDDGADSADDTNTEHGIAPDQDGLHSGEGLDDMLRIEDELSIEQILLYRSIARSAKIGGSSRVKVRGRPTSSLGRLCVVLPERTSGAGAFLQLPFLPWSLLTHK